MLGPRSKNDEAVAIAKPVAQQFSVGDPVHSKAKLGPPVRVAQQDRVRKDIRKVIEAGATLVTGGPEQPSELANGFYVKPTVFAHVNNNGRELGRFGLHEFLEPKPLQL